MNGALHTKKGLTLIETMVTVALFSILAMLAMGVVIDYYRMIAAQEAVLKTDQRGNVALNAVARELKSAILPVRIVSAQSSSTVLYDDIDHRTWGFGNANGERWRERLGKGMDNIAFVVPIDAQNVGKDNDAKEQYYVDFLDSENHLQVGQTRGPGKNYMSASASGTPGSNFVFRNHGADEPICVLNSVVPAQFDNESFEKILEPTNGDWGDLRESGGWPAITSFMAIRFVPLLTGGAPVVIKENGSLLNKTGQTVQLDLDGDGATAGQFHVGMLQLVYSGGTLPVVRNNAVATETVPQLTMALTPYNVLRPTDRSAPIFRLVSADYNNLDGTGNGIETDGEKVLAIRFLMLDSGGITTSGTTGTVVNSIYQTSGSFTARWYQTTVALRGMDRN